MLENNVVDKIRSAVSALACEDVEAGAWTALTPLLDLQAAGVDIDIDLRASDVVGGPVIIVARAKAPSPDLTGLTPRQTDVAVLITDGLSNAEIARTLEISVPTVKDHVHAILKTLKLESRGKLSALVHGRRV